VQCAAAKPPSPRQEPHGPAVVPRAGAWAAGDRDWITPTAVYCHGTAALVDLKLSDGSYLVEGKTITGFSNAEEEFNDTFVGQKVMPWRVEDVLKERGANYVQGGLFKAFAIRDGRLITGQQQYSGRKVAEKVLDALGL
jgi:putative intracellular protease/amidase